ncbi:MAG: hypothetical protein Kow0074_00350 [Candidatus Zixiibacteriota bacterium]
MKKTTRQQARTCRFCKSPLEERNHQWVCLSCLIIWHGDTFEPIRLDPTRIPPLDMFFS